MAKRPKKSQSGGVTFSSMTGYGKASVQNSGVALDVEVRTLNNRFLDINLKLPRAYAELEMETRDRISKALRRGRVDISVTRTLTSQVESSLEFRAKSYAKLLQIYYREARKEKVLDDAFKRKAITEILGRRDVLETADDLLSLKNEGALFLKALDKALSAVQQMRTAEGNRLAQDMKDRCRSLLKIQKNIAQHCEQSAEKHRQRLLQRLSSIKMDVSLDPGRLEAEVALLVDRSDVTEEIVRIGSHLQAIEDVLKKRGDGKKLEFIVQELGREFNTIGSKSADSAISAEVVAAKTELERIREQVQNLE